MGGRERERREGGREGEGGRGREGEREEKRGREMEGERGRERVEADSKLPSTHPSPGNGPRGFRYSIPGDQLVPGWFRNETVVQLLHQVLLETI